MTPIDPDLLERARGAAATVSALAARTEADRRLPPEAVSALASAGIFKLLVPQRYGGRAASVPSTLAVLELVAAADGAAGWCSMIIATSGLMSLCVEESVAREIYAPDDALSCGVFAPMGRAVRVDGGFRVLGRWPFASGCQHAAWLTGGAIAEGAPALPAAHRTCAACCSPRSPRSLALWIATGPPPAVVRISSGFRTVVRDPDADRTAVLAISRACRRHAGCPRSPACFVAFPARSQPPAREVC